MSNFACTNCGKSISPAASYGTHDSGPMCLACYTEPVLTIVGPVAVYLRSSEELAAQIPGYAERAVAAEYNLSFANDEITMLREQVGTLETLLTGYKGIVDALPPCPLHGAGCLRHAKLWIDRAKAVMRED